jgi:hypothetical protein
MMSPDFAEEAGSSVLLVFPVADFGLAGTGVTSARTRTSGHRRFNTGGR